MKIDLITKISMSNTGIRMALWMGEKLPAGIVYRIASLLASAAATRRNSKLMRAIRHNQSVILNQAENSKAVALQAKRIVKNQSRYLSDFYHLLNQPSKVVEKMHFSPRLTEVLANARSSQRGLLLLTTHTSAFDLAGLSFAYHGLQPLVLGVPNPPKSYLWQNRLRNERGLLTLPMSISALGQARERLQTGGLVVTGLDRPLPDAKHHPRFFDRPSDLPVAYVRLALRADARVHVVGCRDMPDGSYQIECSEEVVFEAKPQSDIELIENAEAALRQAQSIIQHDPTLWMMFFPVWSSHPTLIDKG